MSLSSSAWQNFAEWANSPGVIPPLATLAILALYLIARVWGRRPEPTLLDRVQRSSGGVGLACECDFQLGETIFILPDSPTPDTPWIPVRVKSQRKKEGFSVVGCQFLEPLPLTVQLMLG